MKNHISWNMGWGFTQTYTDKLLAPEFVQEDLEGISLPHTNTITPINYFDEECYEKISGYRKIFITQNQWKDKKVFLTFEGIAHEAVVYLNGVQIGAHKGGYTAFTVDMTERLFFDKENILVVKVDSRETLNIPPFGHVIDYMTYGGIYRGAYLEIKEEDYIENIFIENIDVLSALKKVNIHLEVQKISAHLTITYSLLDDSTVLWKQDKIPVIEQETESTMEVEGVTLWSLEEPKLYHLKTELYKGDQLIGEECTRFGFRETLYKADGFYLNGNKVKIRGLNRHQCFPYVGYAMPERAQRGDALILKNELGVNAVRTSHYPQDHSFINTCDEIGLLVFTEIPGWQHIGDEEWKETAQDMAVEMVTQYRNHPSIMIWGVRINESADDDEFYTKTNAIAHKLDPSRQTGGVRVFQKSNLLEDVYTYNDFLHRGINHGVDTKDKVTSDMSKGYMISEYNGHMFPTKVFDDECHRLEHALRHANVIDGYYGEEDIAGGFGWCMFDYNTHKDFGSGDRICHHGVMDMFRNPKLAASVYASQSEEATVLEISSSMDIGEHPSGNMREIYGFTNADSIRMYRNDYFVGEFYPDRANYPNMPHPPIRIDDFIGNRLVEGEGYEHEMAERIKEVMRAIGHYGQDDLPSVDREKMLKIIEETGLKSGDLLKLYYKYNGNWGSKVMCYRFEAMKQNEVVKTVLKASPTSLQLDIKVDTDVLVLGETYDVASIRIMVKDEHHNLLSYYQEPLMLEVSGAIELIGPSVISLKGGMGGTYVRTIGTPGEGILTLSNQQIGKKEISFKIKSRI